MTSVLTYNAQNIVYIIYTSSVYVLRQIKMYPPTLTWQGGYMGGVTDVSYKDTFYIAISACTDRIHNTILKATNHWHWHS